MLFSASKSRFAPAQWGVLSLVLAGLTGCDRNEIQVYRTAKETAADAGARAGHQHDMAPALPKLSWTMPSGWEEAAAGEMRLASFRVKGKDGQTADVGIFPLPGFGGNDLSNVNRWRNQVGLEPVTEEELAKLAQPVAIAGESANLYEQAGENPGSGEKTRILAVVLRKGETAWFFKMTGEDALVAEHKPSFVEFLRSMKFTAGELPPSHPPIGETMAEGGGGAGASAGGPQWQVPAGWAEAPAGQFLVAKYMIGSGAGAASVNVSTSTGDGGGVSGNVNRWRRQIGLEEWPETQVRSALTTLDTAGGKASVVDLSGKDPRTGQDTRVIGAILPRGGQTWFYKLSGPTAVVESQRQAFEQFIRTAKYP